MAFAGLPKEPDRADIIAYLRTWPTRRHRCPKWFRPIVQLAHQLADAARPIAARYFRTASRSTTSPI